MKQITCEMCGGNDLIKDNGLFVCQNCGCKYTLEEAKKLMIEGTVKIDNSDAVENYLVNARRAYDKQDWDEVEKYYNLVEQNEPENLEAIIYSAYAKACTTLIDADYYKKESAFNVLCRCVRLIDDNYDSSRKEIVERVGKDILGLYSKQFVYTQVKNGYGSAVQDDRAKTINLFNQVGTEFVQTCIRINDNNLELNNEERLFFYRLASEVAEVSCKSDYNLLIRLKKLANPESTDVTKSVKVYNDYSGEGRVLYLSIKGLYNKKLIAKGTSTLEILPGQYACEWFYGIESTNLTGLKIIRGTLSIPQNNTISISLSKFLGKYLPIIKTT